MLQSTAATTLGEPRKYVPLSQLAKQATPYERMPIPLADTLRRTLRGTLTSEVIVILLALLVPRESLSQGVSGEFFLLGTDQLVNALLGIGYHLLPYMLVVNTFNLLVTLALLALYQPLSQPVPEPVHWLVAVQSLPTTLSSALLAVLAGLIGVVGAVMVVLWIVLAFIVLCFCLGFLAAMLAG